ncbi:MAG: MFS transporter [Alphaproteobacteria bacterium]|nr:MFS transporter [Alphaproteobacteria bacterium]
MMELASTNTTPQVGPGRREVTAAILMGGVAVSQIVAMPLLATLVANAYGMGESAAGFIGLANLLGTATGSLVVTICLRRLPFRVSAVSAAFLACSAQFAVALMPGFQSALFMEVIAGFGAGILLALSAAIVGGSSDPDRGFAFILTLQAIVAVVLLLVIPGLTNEAGLLPVMAFMACFQAFLIPIGLALGGKLKTVESQGHISKDASAFRPAVLLKAAAYFLFSAAVGVLWVFAGALGLSAGLPDSVIGKALAVGNVAAIAGSLLAAVITSRFGRVGPVVVTGLFIVLSVLLLAPGMSVSTFFVATGLYLFAWGAGLPLMMAAVADVDTSDRVTSLLPVLAFAGMGVGPALVSLGSETGSLFHQVSITANTLVAVSIILFGFAHFMRTDTSGKQA